MNSIFTDKPWLRSQIEISGMPSGMLGKLEGALLYFLSRDYFRGYGEIIDAGSFLGASSYCLAKGLDDNANIRSKSGRVHAYDLFEVWLEQETTEQFMASELKRIFAIDVGDNESTLHLYMANVGTLARHIRVYRGDITQESWSGRPIEILFIDICKSRKIWQHVLRMFYHSLIPGVSVVVHQDYHHPLLPFIHVTHERLARYFQIVDQKTDDSATFLLTERIPDSVLNEASAYDFDFCTELKLMDGAIERLTGQNRHLKIAKCQLLRQNSRIVEARQLIDQLKQEIDSAKEDPKFPAYIGFVEHNLFRDEAKLQAPPVGFDEAGYLDANPDVKKAISVGTFDSAFHHWLQFGTWEGRRWTKPQGTNG
jgi:Methyltransferase domain